MNSLRVRLTWDGGYEYERREMYNAALQNADITFSMYREDGRPKVIDAPCRIVPSLNEGCGEYYLIEYRWNERDTREKGVFRGRFTIRFRPGTLFEEKELPEGILVAPVQEDLCIVVR